MDCEVAREALSARMDGEREPVPSGRVDEHVSSCRLCAEWYRVARQQSFMLETLAANAANGFGEPAGEEADAPPQRAALHAGLRYGLGALGLIQLCLALVQALGVDFGLVSAHHGAAGGAHLLNESTAWSAALGVTLIAAAVRPVFAPGAASAAGVYALALAFYVVIDSMNGHVTAARVASHVPVLLGAVLASLLWRQSRPGRRSGDAPTASPNPESVPHGDLLSERRRRRLGSPDNSAA